MPDKKNIRVVIHRFLLDCQVRELSENTVRFYHQNLNVFADFCEQAGAYGVESITPDLLREFLLGLKEGHSKGGVHAFYRATRVFFFWYEREYESDTYQNPMVKVKVKAPRLEKLEPVNLEDFKKMARMCVVGEFYGDRNRAILYFLLDTGLRARELLAVKLEEIDLLTGRVTVPHGKGDKFRTVYIDRATAKLIKAYLKHRRDDGEYLWTTQSGYPLSYGGLRDVIEKQADLAGIDAPSLHAFRRAFVITMLRNGMPQEALMKITGHSDVKTLGRYANFTEEDAEEGHRKFGPIVNL